jgi:hypothetical protein
MECYLSWPLLRVFTRLCLRALEPLELTGYQREHLRHPDCVGEYLNLSGDIKETDRPAVQRPEAAQRHEAEMGLAEGLLARQCSFMDSEGQGDRVSGRSGRVRPAEIICTPTTTNRAIRGSLAPTWVASCCAYAIAAT